MNKLGKHSWKYFVKALNKVNIYEYINLGELSGYFTMDAFPLTYQSSINQFECRWWFLHCYLSTISLTLAWLWRRQGRASDLIYFLLYKAELIMFHFLCSIIFSQPNYQGQGFLGFCVCACVCDEEHFSNFIHNLLQDLNP